VTRDPLDVIGLAGRAGLALLPGALVLCFGLNAGGFFPDSVAFAAIIVLQALVLRTIISDEPAGGFRLLACVIAAALAGLTVWTLVSSSWSEAPGRALVDADRTLLYTAVFVLFASVPRRHADLAWMVRGVALALLALCVIGLLTRLYPETFPVDLDFAADRLSHPLTYWNAQGLVAAVGLVFAFHLTSEAREPLAVRAIAAGAVPILAVTLYFTFSRGAIVAGVAGLLLYLVLTRGAGQLAALAVAGPATVVALVLAYDADELASREPATALAADQGRELAVALVVVVLVAIVARAAVGLLSRRFAARLVPQPRQARLVAIAWAVIAVTTVVGLVAVDAPDRAVDAADTFFNGDPQARPGGAGDDLRDRLADALSNGRTEHWEVALDAFSDEPLRGHGAAMYEALWSQDRDIDLNVLDAHSLYLEVMAELGLVGTVLLVLALGGILVAFAAGVRGPEKALYACLLGAAVAWCVRAAGDWDWEMPATGIWLFALGGYAAAAQWRRREEPAHASRWALPMTLGWLVIAVAPLLVMLSQSDLTRAQFELGRGDCTAATEDALASLESLSSRREPYEVIGYCQAVRGFPRQGVDAMRRAVEQDPGSWQAHFGLGVVRAQAGEDPTADLQRAQAMNPRENIVTEALDRFREAPRRRWPQAGAESQQAALDSGRLSVAAQ
jgi:hypothetical protein